ncbi:sensor histidine kinase [Pseudonocardia sp. TRM90224]|uniref:sensor histidine kinase n=1 Tax=Pseudonocardia sp. TRM90224 TaxID=2812678 RepID=UPI001E4C68CE|nr:HAMP domain-containing sensor histidine kinase [Pseudonocardia sp. TRM90224]
MRFAPKMSVRLRATLSATAVVALALGVASYVLVGVLSRTLQDNAADAAFARADAVVSELSTEPGVVATPSAGVIFNPDVQVRGRVMDATPVQQTVPAEVWAPPERYLVAARTATVDGAQLIVEARQSLDGVLTARDTLVSLLVPGIPALLLLVAGMTWFAVGRALAPVTAIRKELAEITATDLHRRVPVPRAGDEVAQLATTTNHTLDRLEQAVEQHQRFVADAAHELRSPLAVLRTRLEIAPQQPLTVEALTDVERIQQLASDLLLLARLDAQEPPPRDEVDLGQIAAEEAVRSRDRGEVAVDLQIAPGVVVAGSADELRRLVTNLVDNAVRHAAGRVVVRLRPSGPDAVLDVGDDGPGIPVDQREAVFGRFTRLDEARDRDQGGTGLGLAIARDITTRHKGTLAVVSGPPGGHLRARIPLHAAVVPGEPAPRALPASPE